MWMGGGWLFGRERGGVKVSVVMIQLVPDYIIMFLPEAPVSSTSGNNPLPHNDCFSDCSLCRFEDDRKRQNLNNYITKLRVHSLPAFTSRALSRACLRPKWQTDLHMHLLLDSVSCRTGLARDEHSLLPARERNDFYARYGQARLHSILLRDCPITARLESIMSRWIVGVLSSKLDVFTDLLGYTGSLHAMNLVLGSVTGRWGLNHTSY
jgi:hypothetical protein